MNDKKVFAYFVLVMNIFTIGISVGSIGQVLPENIVSPVLPFTIAAIFFPSSILALICLLKPEGQGG